MKRMSRPAVRIPHIAAVVVLAGVNLVVATPTPSAPATQPAAERPDPAGDRAAERSTRALEANTRRNDEDFIAFKRLQEEGAWGEGEGETDD
jgi:hypothetical protein